MLLRFEDDPDGGAGATREMSASWGSFQLWVRGQNLCAHLEENEAVDGVHWYLLPLLEWLAENWVPLLHESKPPERNAADDGWQALDKTAFPPVALDIDAARTWERRWSEWWQRHSLLACRDGGLFPDVVLRRWQDRIELSWGETQLAGMPDEYRFLATRGVERLAPQEVAASLFGVLRSAADFLSEELPHSQRLKKLRDKILALPSTSADSKIAWMAGLGRSRAEMISRWEGIRRKLEDLPQAAAALWDGIEEGLVAKGSCQVALMFGSAAPTLVVEDIVLLAQRCLDAYAVHGRTESAKLRKLVRHEPAPVDGSKAWADGYRLAEGFIESLDTHLTSVPDQVDIREIIRELQIHVADVELRDHHIRAVSVAGVKHRPTIHIQAQNRFNSSPAGQRFTLAHELCHILFDRAAGRELALISGSWAPLSVEQRANAFAAMLLMPTELVRRATRELGVREDTGEGVRALAKRFGTSVTATLEHVGNLQQWDEGTRDRVRAEVE